MKRLILLIILILTFLKSTGITWADPTPTPPIICGCPAVLNTNIYTNTGRPDGGGQCVNDLATFEQDPAKNHLWIEDPVITAQGKADERARQFLFWVFRTGSIDTHPSLTRVWNFSRNVTFFLLLLVAAVIGIGYIVGQRANFSLPANFSSNIVKLLLLLLYVAISSSLVIVLIQLSDTLMKFFIEQLGGRDLLNIDFGVLSNEQNYLNFVGCRDLNIRVQESVETELLMLKLTNLTYYILGVMLLLRKILLWFLLFVSPFLAILLPFVFIRNVGWIWIGVFFQWLFYGPLVGLFLGGLTSIWKSGIPFIFDFSRVETDPSRCNPAGYIYPTAINILYGGPAQKLAPCSNVNYIDTFAEYIISLIMLWGVIFFPWWLLRIFRDYCCEGIYASKNILLSIYDQMRGGPPSAPSGPVPTPSSFTTGIALKIPKEEEIKVRLKLETVEEIKKTRTEDIARSLSFSVSHLTDIARFETNKQTQETVSKNLNLLQNPMKAETPTERQKYMNIRSELFNRAIKEDKTAKQVLSSLSTSRIEQVQKREEFIKSISTPIPVTHVISVKIKIPQEKISSITSTVFNTVSANDQAVAGLAQNTGLQPSQVKSVLNSLSQNVGQPVNAIPGKVSQQTGLDKNKVAQVIQAISSFLTKDKALSKTIAQEQNIPQEQIERVVKEQFPVIAEPEKHIEKTIAIPASISLDEYEQVKKMWRDQYQRGEVPVSARIKSRQDWLEQDIIFITNTLNKLISIPAEVRQEGLDDLGFILPIFLINNLSADELLVYLKAKLEAAKEVKELSETKKEAEEKAEGEKVEELVEAAKPKEQAKEKAAAITEDGSGKEG